jgi:hypothetical protein
VLGGPSLLGSSAVVVGPDDLVEETLAAEDLIEQQLAVMRLSIVDVEVEGAARCEQSVSFAQPWLKEREVVVELVEIRRLGEQARLVAATRKPRAIAVFVGYGLEGLACLRPAGVERWVDVDQLEGLAPKARQNLKVLSQDDLAVAVYAGNLSDGSADAPATARRMSFHAFGSMTRPPKSQAVRLEIDQLFGAF